MREIIRPGTHFDFVGKWRIAVPISIAILLAGLTAALVQGVRFGIDFDGGTEMLVRFGEEVAVDEESIRGTLQEQDVEAQVVRFGDLGGNIWKWVITDAGLDQTGFHQI